MFYVTDICYVILGYAFYITNSRVVKAGAHFWYNVYVHCVLRVACMNKTFG